MFCFKKKAKRRHLLNEDKLFEKLRKFGFERVYFEDLSFENQIYLSLNTKNTCRLSWYSLYKCWSLYE